MGPIVQTGITLLAVGLATAYLGRRVVRQMRGRGGSKCAGCSASGAEHAPAKKRVHPSS